jgi:hypothetical protein
VAVATVTPAVSPAQLAAANNLDTHEISQESFALAHGHHSTADSEVGEAVASSTGNRAVRQVSGGNEIATPTRRTLEKRRAGSADHSDR